MRPQNEDWTKSCRMVTSEGRKPMKLHINTRAARGLSLTAVAVIFSVVGFIGQGAVANAATPASGGASSPTVTAHDTATTVYSCNGSDVLSGETCTATTSTPATATAGYTCASGTLSGDTCTITTTTPAASNQEEYVDGSTPTYGYVDVQTGTQEYCPEGTLSGGTCGWSTVESSSACSAAGGDYTGYYCDFYSAASTEPTYTEEYEQTGTTPTYGYETVYSCTAGTLDANDDCDSTSSVPAVEGQTYSCSTGTLSGTNCVTTSTYAATPTLTCPTGEELDGTNCTTPSTPPTGGSSPPPYTGGSTPPTVTTYTASAIATTGEVFTATSTVSQTAAQTAANAEATAYDEANPTEISSTHLLPAVATPPTAKSHSTVSMSLTIANAPDGAKGVITETLIGPIKKTAGACRTAPDAAFKKAKRKTYTKSVVGSGSFKITAPTPKTPGCYAWQSDVTYPGGIQSLSLASGKTALFIR